MAVIIVIDDEPIIRRFVRRVLEEAGHEVSEAEDGDAGLTVLRLERPALVITDLFMPNKEGIEVIQEIRRLQPAIPILAMSGGGSYGIDVLSMATALGANEALQKPFRRVELLGAVERLLPSRS